MRFMAAFACSILFSIVLSADERKVDFDSATDFSKIKTFAIRDGGISSEKPELNNRLFLQKVSEAIRAQLTAKGLKETSATPDAFIDFNVSGQDYNAVAGRRGTALGGGRGVPVVVIPGSDPSSPPAGEGTLVIDMKLNPGGALVWRGTSHDTESSGPRLARKIPADAMKLLAQYPPKKH
jgi:hypothetical protein